MSQPHDGSESPVEYLGDEPAPRRRSRKGVLLGAGAAVVIAGAAAGAWGVTQFLDGGPDPASVVPADALAFVSVDFDPDGGQKVEAYRTLKKFPALEDKIGVSGGDDLRRAIFEAATADSPCDDLDFEDDVDSWLGSSFAFGAVPGEDQPDGFGVVEVDDEDAAEAGLEKLVSECGGEGDSADEAGIAFVDGFMVVAETQEVADGIVADVDGGSLADDADYQRWVEAAGGSGIVTAYVAAGAPQALSDAAGGDPDTLAGGDMGLDPFDGPGLGFDAEKLFADFEGAAVVARFDGGALEVETAAGGLPTTALTGTDGAGAAGVGDLPATTAVALGMAVAPTTVQDLLDSLAGVVGQDELDSGIAQAEAATGLSIPEDVQTLLGDGVAISLDSSADLASVVEGAGDPTQVPAGIRIVGDTDEIESVVQKILAAAGPVAQAVTVETGDGVVALGFNADYVAELAGDGGLADSSTFTDAVPDLDGSSGALFVDFDAGDWLAGTFGDDADSQEIEENVEPLNSLGASSSSDDGVVHGLLRVTTD